MVPARVPFLDGVPGEDAYYTAYHWTKAVCETCGSINTNMAKTDYGYLKNVYWLYDCANNFFRGTAGNPDH